MRAIVFAAGILLSACASSSEPSRTAGEVFRDCRECPQMVAIPAGPFMMGARFRVFEHHSPVHRVSVADFAIGRYEVTFDEWDACVRGGGCASNPNPGDQGWGRGRRPVINVSWNDAQEYVQWLSARTGEAYRLPSEAEWEYADDEPRPYSTAWLGWGIHDRERRPGTIPVGSHAPNFFGVYDKVGNVREWVQDGWNDSFDGAPSDGSAWMGLDDYPVVRDRSWQHGLDGRQETTRREGHVDSRYDTVGFRVARSLTGVRNPNPLPAPLSGPLDPPLENGYYVFDGSVGPDDNTCGASENPLTLSREVTLHASHDRAASVVATVPSGERVDILDCRVYLRPLRGEVLRTDHGFEAGRPVYLLYNNVWEFGDEYFEHDAVVDFVWHQGEIIEVPYELSDDSDFVIQWEPSTAPEEAVCWFELEARGVRGWGQSADLRCYWTRWNGTGE